jgi:hypothetical protein
MNATANCDGDGNSSERNPPSMSPSYDAADTMIGDFMVISISISNNDLHFI